MSDVEVSAGTSQGSNTINGWEDETLAALDLERFMTLFLSQLYVHLGHSAASIDRRLVLLKTHTKYSTFRNNIYCVIMCLQCTLLEIIGFSKY